MTHAPVRSSSRRFASAHNGSGGTRQARSPGSEGAEKFPQRLRFGTT